MKTTLVLAPHGDDESLFAAYTCMRTKAHIIVCTHDSDPTIRRRRLIETASAARLLGCSHHVWPMSEDSLDLAQAKLWLEAWNSTTFIASTPNHVYAPAVYAPAVEKDGHEQHNAIGQLALDVFGPKVIGYLTYAPRGQRSREGTEVEPTPAEIVCKLQALACYETQVANPMTRPWFFELLDLREWVQSN